MPTTLPGANPPLLPAALNTAALRAAILANPATAAAAAALGASGAAGAAAPGATGVNPLLAAALLAANPLAAALLAPGAVTAAAAAAAAGRGLPGLVGLQAGVGSVRARHFWKHYLLILTTPLQYRHHCALRGRVFTDTASAGCLLADDG